MAGFFFLCRPPHEHGLPHESPIKVGQILWGMKNHKTMRNKYMNKMNTEYRICYILDIFIRKWCILFHIIIKWKRLTQANWFSKMLCRRMKIRTAHTLHIDMEYVSDLSRVSSCWNFSYIFGTTERWLRDVLNKDHRRYVTHKSHNRSN